MKVFRLEQQLKELKMSSKASNANNVRTHKTTPANTETDRIGLYVRKFTVMNEHTLPHAAFLVQRPIGVKSDDFNC
jgi:hypothetical protein